MIKNIFMTLVILTLSLHANDKEITLQEMGTPQVCEEVYDNCSTKCEEKQESDIPKCFAQCEALYDNCLDKHETELKDKQ